MSTASNPSTAEWVPTDEALGARLALVRWREGWNAKEAAIACGLPAQSWRDWEAGARPRDMVDVCRKIADRTGASFYWLLTGEQTSGSIGDPGGGNGRGLPRADSNGQPAGYRRSTQSSESVFRVYDGSQFDELPAGNLQAA